MSAPTPKQSVYNEDLVGIKIEHQIFWVLLHGGYKDYVTESSLSALHFPPWGSHSNLIKCAEDLLDIINTETEKRLGEGQLDLQGGSKNRLFVDGLNISNMIFVGGGGEEVDVFPEFRMGIGQAC